jgi:hypothetical protein
LVSFKWTGRGPAASLSVAGLWRREGERWKLAVRCIDPAGPDAAGRGHPQEILTRPHRAWQA